MRRILAVMSVCTLTFLPITKAQVPDDPYANRVARASDEGTRAIKRIQIPKGMKVELWAAEPMLANPVSFCFDEKGRCFVAETFRHSNGVTDNRSHMNWLVDELASRTVADRVALYEKHEGKNFASYAKEHDRVRLLEDTKGEGRADKATVFADGFNNPEDGIGAGVLARRGKVWYTCIPHLWQLQDTKGSGRSDVKESLQSGYGVHVAFIGHDLHGLKMGPDGKLYFSIGDRGLHVEKDGKLVSFPDGGAVLRCDPDGSNLELFAQGLRNPQELVFDKFGNLFTGDNNADGGDAARWVHVVEGGDSGWRIGYQYLDRLGPWNAEKMWHKQHEGQPAHLMPPVEHIASGPSGLTYHPGVALIPDRFKDHFFLADFRGSAAGSGIHSFALKPRGVGFEIIDRQQFVWSVLATDCDFGPDGAFYVLDWTEGWDMPMKGRIYKVFEAERAKDASVLEVKQLLAEGMQKRETPELAKLLDHQDMRIRQEAQFSLVEREEAETLGKIAGSGRQLARLHAIWGLGQISRKSLAALKPVVPLLSDADAEVRAQSARVLGDGKMVDATDALVALLKDKAPRVRFFAAQALGKLGRKSALPAILDLVRTDRDGGPYVRHVGVMALVNLGDKSAILAAADDQSSQVRLISLLAMRRRQMPEAARFLMDSDPAVVVEAARAINDEPIADAIPHLAALLNRPAGAMTAMSQPVREQMLLRAINANFRLGKRENAQRLADFAAASSNSEASRIEAIRQLANWEKPSPLDRVVGLYRPLSDRPNSGLAEMARPAFAGIFSGPEKVRAEGVKLAAKLGVKEIGPVLREIVADRSKSASMRVESLRALAAMKDAQLDEVAQLALSDDDPRLRHHGRRIIAERLPPAKAVAMLDAVLENGTTIEKQGALAILAGVQDSAADATLATWMDRLSVKKVPAELRLDILEAARRRTSGELKERLKKHALTRPKDDALAQYRDALVGGDADAGRRLFFERAELSCVRCHKVSGVGGDVGPDLVGIGKRHNREYLLESIALPDKQIAKDFDSVVLTLRNGQSRSGILKSETEKEVRIMTAEGQLLTIPTAQIEERSRGKSAMPEDLIQKMSLIELRDLVEFLAGL